MSVLIVVALFVQVLLVGLSLAMPSLVPPHLPFGVQVPVDHQGDPAIAAERRRYQRLMLASGVVLLAVDLVLITTTKQPLWLIALAMVQLVVQLLAWVHSHGVVARAKSAGRWYAGTRQVGVADTSLRTNPQPFPWAWGAPSAVIALVTLVIGVVRYPSLPASLIVHVGAGGGVQHAAKSIPAAFTGVVVQVVVTALVLASCFFSLRSRPDLDPADPRGSARDQVQHSAALVRGVLAMLVCVEIALSVTSVAIWWSRLSSTAWLGATVLPVGVGVLVLVAVVVREGVATRQVPALAEGSGTARRDDDRYWRGGLFYVNHDDPAVVVPKRTGLGWTLNMANRWVQLLGALIVVGVVASLVVPVLTGH